MKSHLNYYSKLRSLGCLLFELIKLEKYFDFYEEFKLVDTEKNKALIGKLNTLEIFKQLLCKYN